MNAFAQWIAHPLTTAESLSRAIAAERMMSEKPLLADVVEVQTLDNVTYMLFCKPDSVRLQLPDYRTMRTELDDDWEDSEVHEAGGSWEGRVSAVNTEACVVVLEISQPEMEGLAGNLSVPQAGDSIVIEAKPFLAALQNLADGLPRNAGVLSALMGAAPEAAPEVMAPWDWGRESQKDSLKQPSLFVWGPPGTGKTTAAGWRVAQALMKGKSAICLAPTHVAVDRLTLAIDDAWSEIKGTAEPGFIVRAGEPRVDELKDDPTRSHLLLWAQTYREFNLRIRDVLDRIDLAKIRHKQKPSKELELKIREAAKEIKNLRIERAAAISSLVRSCCCLVVNTCQWTYHDSMRLRQWDLAVFDEASMIPMAYPALAAEHATGDVMRTSFAFYGDFLQLEPICISTQREVASKHWLASSPFMAAGCEDQAAELIDAGVMCMLKEQSRMTPAICDYVSRKWYMGALQPVDAPDPLPSSQAHPGGPVLWVRPLECKSVPREFQDRPPMAPSGGKRYYRSAWVVGELVRALLDEWPGKSISVMAPFRSQVKHLERLLGDELTERITLGTVHRMQGSEADIVILDIVNPCNGFVDQYGERLARVAISRTRQQIILVAERQALWNRHYNSLLGSAFIWAPD